MNGTQPEDARFADGAAGVGGFLAANRWVLLASVPLFLVLAGVVYLTIAFAQDERNEQAWVEHTYKVMDSLRTLLSDAADAETGQRGYLLTRKASFLAPYRDAQTRIARDLAQFEYLTRDNTDQQKRGRALRDLMEGRLRILEQGLDSGSLATPVPPALK